MSSGAGNRYDPADFPLMVVAAQSESRWAQTCPVSRAVVTSKVDAATSITKAQLAILVLSVIGLIAINIVIGYYELKHLLSNEAEDEEDRSIHRKKNCCSILLGAGKIIPMAIAFGAASSLYGELHSITTSSPPCSDATTMQSFALLDETASGIVSKNRALIAIAIVEIIMTLYDCYKVAKQSQNDDTMFKI